MSGTRHQPTSRHQVYDFLGVARAYPFHLLLLCERTMIPLTEARLPSTVTTVSPTTLMTVP